MGGVFIIQGMGVRPSSLVVAPDGNLILNVETRFDVYPALLETAMDHVDRAEEDNARLVAAVQSGDPELKKQALIEELKDVLVAVATSAFALEAFQARVADVVEIPDELREAWKKNSTRRARRIVETLKRGFRLPPDKWKLLDRDIGELFEFRKFAAHPSSRFEAPAPHPDLGEEVNPVLARFRFGNGRAAARIALRTIHLCIESPKANESVTAWAAEALTFVAPLAERWEARYGPLWPDYE